MRTKTGMMVGLLLGSSVSLTAAQAEMLAGDEKEVLSCVQIEAVTQNILKVTRSMDNQYTLYARSCNGVVFGKCLEGESQITYEHSIAVEGKGSFLKNEDEGIRTFLVCGLQFFSDKKNKVHFVFDPHECRASFE